MGAAEDRLEQDWLAGRREALLEWVWFPKHPRSIRAGDLLVYYAAGRRVFPAVVEVVADAVLPDEEGSERWRWRMQVRPRVVVPQLRDAPTLSQIGLNPLRLRRQSHILLTSAEWERFRAAFLPPIAD